MSSKAARTALVVEDDPVFRKHLAEALDLMDSGARILEAGDGVEALRLMTLEGSAPVIALVDLGLPAMDGLELIQRLNRMHPKMPILVVSIIAHERSLVTAIRNGACGYILKDQDKETISVAVKEAISGNYPLSPSLARHLFRFVRSCEPPRKVDATGLTPRERDTLCCIAQGLTYEETAQQLDVRLSTVQSHIRRLYRKLNVKSQVQAARVARERGLI